MPRTKQDQVSTLIRIEPISVDRAAAAALPYPAGMHTIDLYRWVITDPATGRRAPPHDHVADHGALSVS